MWAITLGGIFRAASPRPPPADTVGPVQALLALVASAGPVDGAAGPVAAVGIMFFSGLRPVLLPCLTRAAAAAAAAKL